LLCRSVGIENANSRSTPELARRMGSTNHAAAVVPGYSAVNLS
jgi:hypothetical protein